MNEALQAPGHEASRASAAMASWTARELMKSYPAFVFARVFWLFIAFRSARFTEAEVLNAEATSGSSTTATVFSLRRSAKRLGRDFE